MQKFSYEAYLVSTEHLDIWVNSSQKLLLLDNGRK